MQDQQSKKQPKIYVVSDEDVQKITSNASNVKNSQFGAQSKYPTAAKVFPKPSSDIETVTINTLPDAAANTLDKFTFYDTYAQEAIAKLKKDHNIDSPLVIIFANGFIPGGGGEGSIKAQEENILFGSNAVYFMPKHYGCGLNIDLGGIYAIWDATITDTSNKKDPKKCSANLAFVAMPNLNCAISGLNTPQDEEYIGPENRAAYLRHVTSQIILQFYFAKKSGNVMVTGRQGCGIFNNKDEDIAAIIYAVSQLDQFKDVKVVYALGTYPNNIYKNPTPAKIDEVANCIADLQKDLGEDLALKKVSKNLTQKYIESKLYYPDIENKIKNFFGDVLETPIIAIQDGYVLRFLHFKKDTDTNKIINGLFNLGLCDIKNPNEKLSIQKLKDGSFILKLSKAQLRLIKSMPQTQDNLNSSANSSANLAQLVFSQTEIEKINEDIKTLENPISSVFFYGKDADKAKNAFKMILKLNQLGYARKDILDYVYLEYYVYIKNKNAKELLNEFFPEKQDVISSTTETNTTTSTNAVTTVSEADSNTAPPQRQTTTTETKNDDVTQLELLIELQDAFKACKKDIYDNEKKLKFIDILNEIQPGISDEINTLTNNFLIDPDNIKNQDALINFFYSIQRNILQKMIGSELSKTKTEDTYEKIVDDGFGARDFDLFYTILLEDIIKDKLDFKHAKICLILCDKVHEEQRKIADLDLNEVHALDESIRLKILEKNNNLSIRERIFGIFKDAIEKKYPFTKDLQKIRDDLFIKINSIRDSLIDKNKEKSTKIVYIFLQFNSEISFFFDAKIYLDLYESAVFISSCQNKLDDLIKTYLPKTNSSSEEIIHSEGIDTDIIQINLFDELNTILVPPTELLNKLKSAFIACKKNIDDEKKKVFIEILEEIQPGIFDFINNAIQDFLADPANIEKQNNLIYVFYFIQKHILQEMLISKNDDDYILNPEDSNNNSLFCALILENRIENKSDFKILRNLTGKKEEKFFSLLRLSENIQKVNSNLIKKINAIENHFLDIKKKELEEFKPHFKSPSSNKNMSFEDYVLREINKLKNNLNEILSPIKTEITSFFGSRSYLDFDKFVSFIDACQRKFPIDIVPDDMRINFFDELKAMSPLKFSLSKTEHNVFFIFDVDDINSAKDFVRHYGIQPIKGHNKNNAELSVIDRECIPGKLVVRLGQVNYYFFQEKYPELYLMNYHNIPKQTIDVEIEILPDADVNTTAMDLKIAFEKILENNNSDQKNIRVTTFQSLFKLIHPELFSQLKTAAVDFLNQPSLETEKIFFNMITKISENVSWTGELNSEDRNEFFEAIFKSIFDNNLRILQLRSIYGRYNFLDKESEELSNMDDVSSETKQNKKLNQIKAIDFKMSILLILKSFHPITQQAISVRDNLRQEVEKFRTTDSDKQITKIKADISTFFDTGQFLYEEKVEEFISTLSKTVKSLSEKSQNDNITQLNFDQLRALVPVEISTAKLKEHIDTIIEKRIGHKFNLTIKNITIVPSPNGAVRLLKIEDQREATFMASFLFNIGIGARSEPKNMKKCQYQEKDDLYLISLTQGQMDLLIKFNPETGKTFKAFDADEIEKVKNYIKILGDKKLEVSKSRTRSFASSVNSSMNYNLDNKDIKDEKINAFTVLLKLNDLGYSRETILNYLKLDYETAVMGTKGKELFDLLLKGNTQAIPIDINTTTTSNSSATTLSNNDLFLSASSISLDISQDSYWKNSSSSSPMMFTSVPKVTPTPTFFDKLKSGLTSTLNNNIIKPREEKGRFLYRAQALYSGHKSGTKGYEFAKKLVEQFNICTTVDQIIDILKIISPDKNKHTLSLIKTAVIEEAFEFTQKQIDEMAESGAISRETWIDQTFKKFLTGKSGIDSIQARKKEDDEKLSDSPSNGFQ